MANLTTAQLQTLKTDITVTQAAVVYNGETLLHWWTTGNNNELANFYNEKANPVHNLWRPNIPVEQLAACVVGSEFIGRTQAERELWSFVIAVIPSIDSTEQKVRDNFVTAFGGGSVTVTSMTGVAQRNASNGEKLFSTLEGGANKSSIFDELITANNISDARLV